jgi:hypothetical protein
MPMCDGKMPGFFARQAIYAEGRRLNRNSARQQCQCHVPQPTVRQRFDAASDTAGKWVVGIAAVIVMSAIGGGAVSTAAGWTLGVVKIGLGVAAGLVAAAVTLTVWRRVRIPQRQHPVMLPAPLPDAPRRTSVTHVNGRAIAPQPATRPALDSREAPHGQKLQQR